MSKLTNISNNSHVRNITSSITKPVLEVIEQNSQISEMSKVASDSISAMQKGLIAAKTKVLDINSEACKFFGVDNPIDVNRQIENHIKLSELKCKQNNILDRFPLDVFVSLDNQMSMGKAWGHLWYRHQGRQFEYLYSRPARMTFVSKLFGKNGEKGFHTIGVVFHPESKTLYILDSLPNSIKEVREYQDILMRRIFAPMPQREINNIIISSKPQQNMNEYTCNNWTFANIEALQKALKDGKTIDSVEKLNEVLPDDINKILSAQREFVLNN